jgi:transcriptional regulator with XRE-family HTH domain
MIRGVDENVVQHRVGRWIRSNRLKAGLTQQDVAHALGLTRSSISNIEAGTQSLSLVGFLRLTQELDVSPGEFLDVLNQEMIMTREPLPDMYQSWVDAIRRNDSPDESFAVTDR